MADGTMEPLVTASWSGGVSPYAVSHKKLGMWLFILSDSLTFSALLIVYSYVRVASGTWPTPFHFMPSIVTATVMTFCLLSSSLTMVFGVAASKRGDAKATVRFILLTILGGLAFLVLHVNEWRNLIAEGVGLSHNPWGAPLFGGTFFTLTGLHMAHVASGVIYLGAIAWGVSTRRYGHDQVEVSGLYWHFVDLVWMFIFPLVYLMSVSRA
jgi:cytochrome c oxidase subunit III